MSNVYEGWLDSGMFVCTSHGSVLGDLEYLWYELIFWDSLKSNVQREKAAYQTATFCLETKQSN